MNAIKIDTVIDRALSGEIVHKLELRNAKKYVANASGSLNINPTIFFSGRVCAYQPTDRVLSVGKKYYNVDELKRQLERFVNKGEVTIFIGREMLRGELVK